MRSTVDHTRLTALAYSRKVSAIKRSLLLFLALLAILTVSCLTGCGGKESATDKPDTNISTQNQTPERFTLRNIYGKKYRWSEFVGKPFVINFWATWCGPCRAEIPGMITVYKEYQPKGLEIIAISLDDERTKDRVAPFLDEFMIPWIVLYGDQAVTDEFQPGQSIPVTLFFDAQGNETARLVGAQSEAAFRRELEKLFDRSHQI